MNSILFTVAFTFLMMLQGTQAAAIEPEWPKECEGKYICTNKTNHYPYESIKNLLKGYNLNLSPTEMENRSSEEIYKDIASCSSHVTYSLVHMIKDENKVIRYVAQIPDMLTYTIHMEECTTQDPSQGNPIYLKRKQLKRMRVECYTRRVDLKFPVLSLDHKSLESIAPYGGVPISCSAKSMGYA